MALTPSDVEKKTFATALRGYDLDEVDDFLDEMVVALRELQDELAKARARVAEMERDPDAAAAVIAPGPDETAVGRALVAAQQAADRMLEDARTEADRLVDESRTEADNRLAESRTEADRILELARSEADTFVKERDQKRAEVEAEMADMTGLVSGVRNQLAVLATTVADKLDEMDGVLSGAHTKMGTVGAETQSEDSAPTDTAEEEPDQTSSIWDDAEGEADAGVEDEEENGSPEETLDDAEPESDDPDNDDEVDLDSLDDVDAEDPIGSDEIEGVEALEDDQKI